MAVSVWNVPSETVQRALPDEKPALPLERGMTVFRLPALDWLVSLFLGVWQSKEAPEGEVVGPFLI